MKNILVILGGGRPNGNTAQLAEAFARGAREAGHRVETVSLLKTEVRGCLGCNACRRGKPCVQRDGFGELVPKIEAADLLVFASPLYFWTFSAKLKALIERFYCLARPEKDPPRGRYEKYPDKDCALLMTAAEKSSIGELADQVLRVNCPLPGVPSTVSSVQPIGSLFDECVLYALDWALRACIQERLGRRDGAGPMHSNLE